MDADKISKDKNIVAKKALKSVSTMTAVEEAKLTISGAIESTESTQPKVVEVDAANLKSTSTTHTVAAKMESVNKATSNSLIIMETISISDGEDSPPPQPVPTTELVTKKRKTNVSNAGEEEHYKLKRRKIKVAGAPKMPLTGYVRYMNERREILKKEQPNKTAMEHTKLIGEEWNQLSEERKSPYMKAAEADKQRYLAELHVFLKARPDVLASELAKNKPRKNAGAEESCTAAKDVLRDKPQTNVNIEDFKDAKEAAKQLTKDDLAIAASATKARAVMHTRRLSVNYTLPTYVIEEKSPPAATPAMATSPVVNAVPPIPVRKRTPTPPNNYNCNNTTAVLPTPLPGEIPIFTNEFLEHNKTVDMELRTLRKSKADLEQQNAVLEKHVENMKFGVEKMVNENDDLQEKNRLLEIYLDKLKRKLASALSGLSIPSEPQGATLENIDKYMNDLYKMATSNTHGPASLNKAKDIIRKLDLQIQL